jgi:hypothetical protein
MKSAYSIYRNNLILSNAIKIAYVSLFMKIVLSIKSQYTCTGLLEHENG